MTEEQSMPDEDLVSRLPDRWRRLATGICADLAAGGRRGWVVGGAVRDLLLGREIKDVDLVSAARPDEVEGLFERTVAVGKSFGIIVVVRDGEEVELATFRRERGYSDRRRPDEVEYADAPEDDAGRRDFTCNAIYLDPLSGEVRDPAGGVSDLRAGVLRAVGDPRGRFREDGLRILRMARFLAALGLEAAPGLLEAAEEERAALGGVSAERVRDELHKILSGPRAARSVKVLVEGGHAELAMPTMGDAAEVMRRLAVLEELGERGAHGPEDGEGTGGSDVSPWEVGLAALFGPAMGLDPSHGGSLDQLAARLGDLRCSKEEQRVVMEISLGAAQILAVALGASEPAATTAAEECGRLVQLWRSPTRASAAQLALAWAAVAVEPGRDALVRGACQRLSALDGEAPDQPATLTAGDLQDLGVPRGPELGILLRRVQRAALGGAFVDRSGALEWAQSQLK